MPFVEGQRYELYPSPWKHCSSPECGQKISTRQQLYRRREEWKWKLKPLEAEEVFIILYKIREPDGLFLGCCSLIHINGVDNAH